MYMYMYICIRRTSHINEAGAVPHVLTGFLSVAPEEGSVYRTSDSRREIGLTSAVFLIFNRMIGTGIFATPSAIFSMSGSVGLSLFIWVAGMIIAATGMAVFVEFGTGIPRNGGEKNYLEFVYRRPKFLATGFYAGYVILLGRPEVPLFKLHVSKC